MSKFIDKKKISFTYGDGVSNVNIKKLIKFHKKNKKMITVTAVRPPAKVWWDYNKKQTCWYF